MNKKLIKNIDEYRKWSFETSTQALDYQSHVDRALGLEIDYECWDYNDKNEPIDEEGNVIPDTTAENMKLADWVTELTFPVVVVHCFEKDWDRTGDLTIVLAEFVELKDFNP